MTTPRPSSFDRSRRRLLLAGAGGLVLAACGSGDERTSASDTTTASTRAGAAAGGGSGALTLLRVFAPEQAAGIPLRLPLAFADADGAPTDRVPDAIRVTAVSPSGVAATPLEVARRGQGIPTPYFPFEATLDEPGGWELRIAAGDAETTTDLTVRPRQELAVVPGPGEALPSIPTPTAAEQLGVEPLCTATPACPFHDASLDQALAAGLPVVLLVATPAFCQTAVCGPVLELLVERQAALAGRATVIHAEVYTDDRATDTTSTVDALGLRYEPSLFVAAADGTVRGRLDYTFDATELDEELGALALS